ncbi:putative transcriptional regulatory protein [Mycobacterium ulcerans str. Harvey]|uniref:Transcriptional regulatory protein n=1 Tax=Mycobacterium ulcerans str. Harvey TaxID=1299332 RepID=A0ABP3A4Q1_MYCUL|nr:putative transcriptional regulatory protein [Mycobacterium ulcerans str. Harvey]
MPLSGPGELREPTGRPPQHRAALAVIGRTARLSRASPAHCPAGRPLPAQVAQLLLDESSEGSVQLAQRTLSAMLGVQRPSLNKILKGFERDG